MGRGIVGYRESGKKGEWSERRRRRNNGKKGVEWKKDSGNKEKYGKKKAREEHG
jgi:hypothetical protein